MLIEEKEKKKKSDQFIKVFVYYSQLIISIKRTVSTFFMGEQSITMYFWSIFILIVNLIMNLIN